MQQQRNFQREDTFSACALYVGEDPQRAFMVNFSQMGAMITSQIGLAPKKYVSLMYKNEKNELIKVISYVIYSRANENYFISGLQFVGIESRTKI